MLTRAWSSAAMRSQEQTRPAFGVHVHDVPVPHDSPVVHPHFQEWPRSGPPTQRAHGQSVSPHLEKPIKPRQRISRSKFGRLWLSRFLGCRPPECRPPGEWVTKSKIGSPRFSLDRQSVDPYRWVSRQMHNQQPKISLGGLGRARRDWVFCLLAAGLLAILAAGCISHHDDHHYHYHTFWLLIVEVPRNARRHIQYLTTIPYLTTMWRNSP